MTIVRETYKVFYGECFIKGDPTLTLASGGDLILGNLVIDDYISYATLFNLDPIKAADLKALGGTAANSLSLHFDLVIGDIILNDIFDPVVVGVADPKTITDYKPKVELFGQTGVYFNISKNNWMAIITNAINLTSTPSELTPLINIGYGKIKGYTPNAINIRIRLKSSTAFNFDASKNLLLTYQFSEEVEGFYT